MKFKEFLETLNTFNKEHNVSDHIEIETIFDSKYVDIISIAMSTEVEYGLNTTKRKCIIKFKSRGQYDK